MAGPWDKYATAPPAMPAVIEGGPKEPSPQTPEQRTATVVGTEQTRTQIANTAFDNVNSLRKQFEAEPSTQDYKTVLPLMDNAFKLGPNKAGDLNLVYAFGKAMDPGSVVREGEQVMATNVGGVSEKVKGYLDAINGQGQLTPTQRTELTEEIRHRAGALQQTYNQRRAFYEDFAKRNGVNPDDVVGPHPGQPFIEDERGYIAAHGGTPKSNGVPIDAPAETPSSGGRFNDGYGAKGTEVQFNDEAGSQTRAKRFHDDLYNALESKQLKSPAQINAWIDQFNQQNGSGFKVDWNDKDTRLAIRAAMTGRQFGVDTPPDPAVAERVQKYTQEGGGALSAAVAGGADAASAGLLPRAGAGVQAVAGALNGEGSFNDLYNVNVDANRGYLDQLQKDHLPSYVVGGLIGSLAVPTFGAKSAAEMAKVGALYGGVFGANQGDSSTSLVDRAANTGSGAASGAALGYAIPKGLELGGRAINALRGSPKAIPPLVDPATGELNQPMDAMRPADRVQSMRDYGMQTVTPGMAGGRTARVLEQGFNNLPASAGHMEDINSAASGELRRSMQGVAQQFGSSKTLNEGGAELQRGAQQRLARSETVTGKAYNAIPISDQAQASTSATVATLQQLTGRFQSNPELASALSDPKLSGYLNAVQKGLSWKDLKDFRSVIGEKIGDMRFGEGHSTSDLRALYAGLSEDMQNTASAMGPKASAAFNRANNLYRNEQNLIDGALTRILGKDGHLAPEKAAAAVQTMTKGGKASGDLKTLAQIKAATVKSGAWDEIASTLIHLGGQPANSEGRAFQPATFVNWYADMSEPARAMLFKPELRKSLDGFVAMTQQLGRLKGLNNTSQTAPVMFGGGALLSAAAALLNPILGLKAAAVLGANYGMGRAWTNPTFVRLVTGYGRAAASGNENAVKSQVGRLSKLAATDPELRAPIESLLKSIANDNAVPSIAASSNPNGDQDQ